jgi:hypothetical protein
MKVWVYPSPYIDSCIKLGFGLTQKGFLMEIRVLYLCPVFSQSPYSPVVQWSKMGGSGPPDVGSNLSSVRSRAGENPTGATIFLVRKSFEKRINYFLSYFTWG